MRFQQTKAKRHTSYQLKLSKSDYDTMLPKIKEALRKIKNYYEKFDLQYDYEISALNQAENTLTIKSAIHFNKRLHQGTTLSEMSTLSDRLEFFISLLEHVN